jgi:3-deoxy-manno-octulosonate cytidylyltransferase (CMP-KDO synthetase)
MFSMLTCLAMKTVIVIPARLNSRRFPRKMLTPFNGTPLLQASYKNALHSKEADRVVVATEDLEIYERCQEWGAPVLMTGKHTNGTARMGELLTSKSLKGDVWVNVQGDEPALNPEIIDQLIREIKAGASIATAVTPIECEEELYSPSCVKCVFNLKGHALYFSRSPIPSKGKAYRHIGIYAFSHQALEEILTLKETPLQQAEDLEQLKILEHGIPLTVCQVTEKSFGVDTKEDLERLEQLWKENTSSSPVESSPR